ncbi:MAG: hypothetical protein J3K34DRAFT_423980 [Monoraphidium minutum]|nr:MAG: hypothetical protein J3K34DRAFT_423980 [Monoraphidium minutum]
MQRRACVLLVLAACVCGAAAAPKTAPKTIKVAWQPPSNAADEMDRPRLLNCGDTLQLTCPPGQRHGVFKIANVSGACPRNFQPVHGDELLPVTKDCDLKIKLNAGDDYFLTSNVPGECKLGMKMLVKVFCDNGATTTSKLNLGAGTPRLSNRTASAYDAGDAGGEAETVSNGAGHRGGGAAAAALGALGTVAAGALLL